MSPDPDSDAVIAIAAVKRRERRRAIILAFVGLSLIAAWATDTLLLCGASLWIAYFAWAIRSVATDLWAARRGVVRANWFAGEWMFYRFGDDFGPRTLSLADRPTYFWLSIVLKVFALAAFVPVGLVVPALLIAASITSR